MDLDDSEVKRAAGKGEKRAQTEEVHVVETAVVTITDGDADAE
jgi:hypothetical protein